MLLADAARSRALKQLRSQLAAKQNLVAADHKRLQVDTMKLAQIERQANFLMSPKYVPHPKDLEMAAQESHIAPPPSVSNQVPAEAHISQQPLVTPQSQE